ncbi:hypothetical protein DOTSEDRAFT_40078 [Dothistroma septosporum NZE10]|uniref:PAC domain-containing protein n=1 Tax=Dothistroma septosporum (strain NZE10 / CBS 128990) TaxID=675120 RepID=N1Q2U0_DOTSN|nr:hypothetical protein DOTSEDRAFT_40078 [Dothistroma septosporum NZE10]
MADPSPGSASTDHLQHTSSLRRKTASVNMSNLRVVNTSPRGVPQPVPQPPPSRDELADCLALAEISSAAPTASSLGRLLSPVASPGQSSVFDIAEQDEEGTESTTASGPNPDGQGFATDPKALDDEHDSYDLKPPPPTVTQDNVEALALRLFSVDHLDSILRDYALASKFSRFLQQYRPQHVEPLKQYTEFKKAAAAVEYANAVARQLKQRDNSIPPLAARLDDHFESRSKKIAVDLVEEALPAYLTHRLVSLVTDTLVKEITGNSAPLLTELIPSLAEVYCITDPSLPDNPIVYASEEFYNTTQYGQEYVIGRNCRFLQGPQTSTAAVRRLIECLSRGEESCETILNYRRDGSPFMNLLMLAPMYDNKGTVRYFLGCQIDVSQLLQGGRGLESFAQLLAQDRIRSSYGDNQHRSPKQVLSDLGQFLTEDEADIVKDRVAPPGSVIPQTPESVASSVGPRRAGTRSKRVVLGTDEPAKDAQLWPSATLGHSGRLPGVYQSYLLVRPYPSLRITFTSPALRIPGLLQSKFLDRVGGPSTVREGLMDALSRGVGVTAKLSWLSNGSDVGRPRWTHCTPLLGSDERVGVWMIVMVEDEAVTGSLNRHNTAGSIGAAPRPGAQQYTSSKMYADYLKHESRPGTRQSQRTNASQEQEDQFQDF